MNNNKDSKKKSTSFAEDSSDKKNSGQKSKWIRNNSKPTKPSNLSSHKKGSSVTSNFVGVSNLKPKCEKTFRLILSNPSSHDVVKYERELWNEIKEYRNENDTVLLNYLVGFYISLLESVMIWPSRKDPYLVSLSYTHLPDNSKLLLYNILIHIGDLNRYLSNNNLAESYYQNARKLNVMRGHAYNQLAIVTSMNSFKCIYYSIRASKSCEEPTMIAESNLKMALNRMNNKLLKKIFHLKMNPKSENKNENQLEIEVGVEDLPDQGADWLYLSVICIYVDNLKPIFKPLINYIMVLSDDKSSSIDNHDLDFAMMSLDVLIDWITIQGIRKSFADEYAQELRDLKAKFNEINDNENSIGTKFNSTKALFHDYVLRGFSLLKEVHSTLEFEKEEELHIDRNALQLRLNDKIEKIFGKLIKPKKMRNVALGSILAKDNV